MVGLLVKDGPLRGNPRVMNTQVTKLQSEQGVLVQSGVRTQGGKKKTYLEYHPDTKHTENPAKSKHRGKNGTCAKSLDDLPRTKLH